MAQALVFLIPSALLIILGAYMFATGNPALLHGYHYATTPLEKLPALARACGAGLIICGAGVGLLCFNTWVVMAGIVLVGLGIVIELAAIIHYNGSLISGGSIGGSLRCLSPGVRIAVCALVGALIAAVCAAPGIHMIVTGDVSALHGYHYANVAASDISALAVGEGASMILLGCSAPVCMVAGGGFTLRRPVPLWAKALAGIGALMLIAGLAGLFGFIIYYNGSLMA